MGLHVKMKIGETLYLGDIEVVLVNTSSKGAEVVVKAPAEVALDREKIRIAKRTKKVVFESQDSELA